MMLFLRHKTKLNIIMVKSSLKLKILQGIIMGISYALIMNIFNFIWGEKFSLVQTIFMAVFFGGIMGFLLPFITERQVKKMLDKVVIDISEDEQLKMEGGATLKSKLYSDGGKLILTNKRLAFKPHKMNIKKTFVETPLNKIIEIEKLKTLGLIDNVFKVKTNSEEYKFIVYENERDTWVSTLNNSLN